MLSLNRLVCLADDDASPGRAASAFALEPLLDTGVVVGFRSHLLSGIKLGVVVWRGDRCQIALPHIDTHDLRHHCWSGVGGHDGERDQEIEAVFGAIIPEFGPANLCSLLEPGHMAGIALIGEDQSPIQRQHTHAACRFERVVPSGDIGERGRDIVGWLVQALEAFLRPARFARFYVFVPFRPQGFVGSPDLPEDTAGHLRRQTTRGTGLLVELVVQALAVGGLAMRKSMQARLIERITIGQLRAPQPTKLLGVVTNLSLAVMVVCMDNHSFSAP